MCPPSVGWRSRAAGFAESQLLVYPSLLPAPETPAARCPGKVTAGQGGCHGGPPPHTDLVPRPGWAAWDPGAEAPLRCSRGAQGGSYIPLTGGHGKGIVPRGGPAQFRSPPSRWPLGACPWGASAPSKISLSHPHLPGPQRMPGVARAWHSLPACSQGYFWSRSPFLDANMQVLGGQGWYWDWCYSQG